MRTGRASPPGTLDKNHPSEPGQAFDEMATQGLGVVKKSIDDAGTSLRARPHPRPTLGPAEGRCFP